jgi:hypothetical protein
MKEACLRRSRRVCEDEARKKNEGVGRGSFRREESSGTLDRCVRVCSGRCSAVQCRCMMRRYVMTI